MQSRSKPNCTDALHSKLRDVDFFQTRLGKIAGFGDASEYLANIVRSKVVEVESQSESKTKVNGEKPMATQKAVPETEVSKAEDEKEKKSSDVPAADGSADSKPS